MSASIIGFILGVIALVIVAPVWIIFHYVTRWKAMNTLSPEDEQMLAELWESARRMESRIETLERLLELEEVAEKSHRKEPLS